MLDGIPLDQIDERLLRTMLDTKFNGIKKESLGMRASCHALKGCCFFSACCFKSGHYYVFRLVDLEVQEKRKDGD